MHNITSALEKNLTIVGEIMLLRDTKIHGGTFILENLYHLGNFIYFDGIRNDENESTLDFKRVFDFPSYSFFIEFICSASMVALMQEGFKSWDLFFKECQSTSADEKLAHIITPCQFNTL